MIHLSFGLGLRAKEMAALKVRDVTLPRGELLGYVPGTLTIWVDNMTTPALDAVTRAAKSGIVVVRSTRLAAGNTLRNYGGYDDEEGLGAADRAEAVAPAFAR